MEMLVRVDVVEGEAGRREGLELGRDLGLELTPHARACKDVEPEPSHVGAKAPVAVDEVGDALGRQSRPPLDQHEVQADAQSSEAVGAPDRVGGYGFRHHQARGGEDAVAMRRLDRLVDLGREAEIVGRDDEALQAATSRRSRRKRRNSRPSRRRRFIISGLRTISPTMAAIFGARK